jgi:hypothetical protein
MDIAPLAAMFIQDPGDLELTSRCGRPGIEVALRASSAKEVDVDKRLRWVGVAVCLAAVAMGAIACGTSAGPAGADASGGPDASGFQAYRDCLARNGVTLPSRGPGFPSGRPTDFGTGRPDDGGFGPGGGGFGQGGGQPPAGVDQATWERAMQACASTRPTGGFTNSALTAYRNCLADHGVTLSAGPGQLDTADPKVAAAMKACAPLRPTGRPRSPTGAP